LILFSYLAPFVSCDHDQIIETSRSENDTVIIDKVSLKVKDSLNQAASQGTQINKTDVQTFWSEVYEKIFYPTNNSISGFGSIFLFPNAAGSILIGISFVISLFLVFRWKFIKIKKRRLYLLLLNLLCIIIFIADGLLLKNVNFLWGIWLLPILLIIDLILEFKYSHKFNFDKPGQ